MAHLVQVWDEETLGIKHRAFHFEREGVVVCGECLKPIRDFRDDLGYFYSMYNGGYVAKCRECNGPLTGDR